MQIMNRSVHTAPHHSWRATPRRGTGLGWRSRIVTWRCRPPATQPLRTHRRASQELAEVIRDVLPRGQVPPTLAPARRKWDLTRYLPGHGEGVRRLFLCYDFRPENVLVSFLSHHHSSHVPSPASGPEFTRPLRCSPRLKLIRGGAPKSQVSTPGNSKGTSQNLLEHPCRDGTLASPLLTKEAKDVASVSPYGAAVTESLAPRRPEVFALRPKTPSSNSYAMRC